MSVRVVMGEKGVRWAEVREVARETLLYLREVAARLTDDRIGAQGVVLTESPVLAVKQGRAENSVVLHLSKLDFAVSPSIITEHEHRILCIQLQDHVFPSSVPRASTRPPRPSLPARNPP